MIAERVLELGGRRARLLEAGAGPPVVLVHGVGLSADIWRTALRVLADDGWRALAPDLPGSGDSDGPLLGMRPEELTEWLVELARLEGAAGCAWVGHSLMAGSVLRVAAEEDAAALVLVSPALPPARFRRLRQLGRLLRDAPRERPSVLAGVLRQYARASAVSALGTWIRDASTDPEALAARVGRPVLILAGAEDPMSALGSLEALRSALPDGRLVTIEGAAHGVALEAPERIAEEVREFLAAARGTSPP